MAILFAQLGAKVALIGRNEEKLKETQSLCSSASNSHDASNFLIVKADLGNVDCIPGILNQVVDHFKKLHILVSSLFYFISMYFVNLCSIYIPMIARAYSGCWEVRIY